MRQLEADGNKEDEISGIPEKCLQISIVFPHRAEHIYQLAIG
jgi:hypothetical protein